ncbi:hypothetical protein ACIRO1_34495 [Streptomyces sp. NPDC102381]|uniref:hypothetical protein n=1 Tax=Streptomyces sp. NPDC102381 TaxID=3366164 RepID=UPI0037FBB74A
MRGLGAATAGILLLVVATPLVFLSLWAIADYYGLAAVERVGSYTFTQWSKVPNGSAPGRDPVFASAFNFASLALGIWIIWRRTGGGAMRKYWLTQRTSAAVIRCAEAKKATGIERPDALRRVDSLARAVERSLWRSHYWRGGMARRSYRRIAAQQHAAMVIGALHRQLDRLDVGSDDAVDDLAKMLARIGEQHAAGHVSALLPPEELNGVVPASLRGHAVRESLLIVRGIVAALAAVFILDRILPSLGIDSDLVGWFQAGGALVAAVVAVGWHRVREFLSIFPGM